MLSLADQLERLANLWLAGALSDEEYAAQKRRTILDQNDEAQKEGIISAPSVTDEQYKTGARSVVLSLGGLLLIGIAIAAIFLWPSDKLRHSELARAGLASNPIMSGLTNAISDECIESVRHEADLLCNLDMDDARKRSNGLVMTYDFARVLKDFRGSRSYCPEFSSVGRSLAIQAFAAVGNRLNTESPMQEPALCRNEVQRRVDDALGRVSLGQEADIRARLEALEGARLEDLQAYVSGLPNSSPIHADLQIDGPISSSALKRFHQALTGSIVGDGQIMQMRDGTFLVFPFFAEDNRDNPIGVVIVDLDKKVTMGVAGSPDGLSMTRRNTRIESFLRNWCFSLMGGSNRPQFCGEFHSRDTKTVYPDLVQQSAG